MMENNVKAEEGVEYECEICQKKYPKQSDLQVHMKSKHEKRQQNGQIKQVSKPKPAKSQPRNRVLQMQQNEHQDIIYAFLGQLGQKHQENTARQDLLLSEDVQRQSVQTNYSFNKVIRTPYQKQMNPQHHIPRSWIQSHKDRTILQAMSKQLETLYEKLESEKQIWQFRDPMGPQQQADNQFSLMEIRKLILNYPKRNLVLKYPQFQIFMLWVGRISKPPAWKQIFMIISTYLIDYFQSEKSGRKSENWQQYGKQYDVRAISQSLLSQMTICDEKTIRKFTELYHKWVQLFELVEFC